MGTAFVACLLSDHTATDINCTVGDAVSLSHYTSQAVIGHQFDWSCSFCYQVVISYKERWKLKARRKRKSEKEGKKVEDRIVKKVD